MPPAEAGSGLRNPAYPGLTFWVNFTSALTGSRVSASKLILYQNAASIATESKNPYYWTGLGSKLSHLTKEGLVENPAYPVTQAGEIVETRSVALASARWIARFWSVMSMLFILAFVIGEIRGGGARPTAEEWVGLALWPVGVGVGLGVAWYREKLGGIFGLACFLAFYVWNLFRSGRLPRGPFFFLVAAPSLLFLVVGLLSHHSSTNKP